VRPVPAVAGGRRSLFVSMATIAISAGEDRTVNLDDGSGSGLPAPPETASGSAVQSADAV